MPVEVEEVTINGRKYSKNGSGGIDLRGGGWFRHCLTFAGDVMASVGNVAASVAAALGHANAAAASAGQAQSYAAALRGSSASQVTLALGPLAFDVGSATKQWAPGVWLMVSRTSDRSKFASGPVLSYVGNVVTIDAQRTSAGGGGPFVDWTLQLSGLGGVPGIQGIPGVQDLPYVRKYQDFEIGAADKATWFDCFNGCSPSFAQPNILGNKWLAYLRNAGTYDVAIAESDGVVYWLMYPGAVRLFWSDGATLRSTPLVGGTRSFTATHVHVWPPGIASVHVQAVGAGSGGGSGEKGPGADRMGGLAGAGGEFAERLVCAVPAGTRTTVLIGAPGTGGRERTTPGLPIGGGAGGDTSFGEHLIAKGGEATYSTNSNVRQKGGGLPVDGAGSTYVCGAASGGMAQVIASIDGGAQGGAAVAGTAGTDGSRSIRGGGGGGGGGGVSAAGAARPGGDGGRSGRTAALDIVGGGGLKGAAGANGTAGTRTPGAFAGSGGGGGGASATGPGGRGGKGGVPGGGGGGGGATLTGASSGPGEEGGRGECFVKEVL